MDEIDFQGKKDVLNALKKRYWDLKLQAASLGINTDPSIKTEIDTIDEQIVEIEKEINERDGEYHQRDGDFDKINSGLTHLENSLKESNPKDWFHFLNREDELRKLRLPNHRRYLYVVDAPSGYGKSALLNRIVSEYQNEGNWCISVIDFKFEREYAFGNNLYTAIWKKISSQDPLLRITNFREIKNFSGPEEIIRHVVNNEKYLLLILDSIDKFDDNLRIDRLKTAIQNLKIARLG